MPHVSAAEVVKVVAIVLAVLGTVRIVALSKPDSALAQALLLLY